MVVGLQYTVETPSSCEQRSRPRLMISLDQSCSSEVLFALDISCKFDQAFDCVVSSSRLPTVEMMSGNRGVLYYNTIRLLTALS